MNLIQKAFNWLIPRDSAEDTRPGVGPFKFQFPWFARPARIHDIQDDLIDAGLSRMSSRESADRFYRGAELEIEHNYEPVVSPYTAKAFARLTNRIAYPLILAVEYLRGRS